MKTIDLNCDQGESFGPYKIGNDEKIIPYVSSINIACGFHAGDPAVMERTVRLAKENGVSIGAHPGFQDLSHFGRRNLPVTAKEAYQLVLYQLGALHAFCRAYDVPLHHVKPHGALYNVAAENKKIAGAIADAIKHFDDSLILYGLSGSLLIQAGKEAGLQTASEVFADRTYVASGALSPRSLDGAVIHDSEKVLSQVRQMVSHGKVTTLEGKEISIKADTICLHGDNKDALLLGKQIYSMLKEEGFSVQSVARWKQ
ncbi:LamB/YcsF family protein [Sutcliffiella sp. NC1]|uniref:LamB/YcsF family protein n=1 Tax=Sutcliffiella sp. NC1 TaxID=3004096 RepID=UPI0022DE630D|nr:5-oxoprolinase subunit PxpA [Sutcliffiella sp. NC1]WBL15009.1 LamB/YcsF family protein [Sutcliffiella sp. NC1]